MPPRRTYQDPRSEFLRNLGPLPSEINKIIYGEDIVPTSQDFINRLNRSLRGQKNTKTPSKVNISDQKPLIRLLNSLEFREYMTKMAEMMKEINELELESFILTCQKYEDVKGVIDSIIWDNFTGLINQWSRFAASLRSAGIEYREFQKKLIV